MLHLLGVVVVKTLLFGSECVLVVCLCLVCTYSVCLVCTNCEVLLSSVLHWECQSRAVRLACILSPTDRVQLSLRCFGCVCDINVVFGCARFLTRTTIDLDRPIGAHRLGLHGVECHLVGFVQVMSAVHLALKARLLPDGVVWAELRGDHPQHRGGTAREDKRLEYGPARVQVKWMDRKERNNESESPITQRPVSRKRNINMSIC